MTRRQRGVKIEPLEPRTLLSAIKVMPLGDSITESYQGHASYRFWLWKKLELRGYDIDFVGSRTGVFANNPPTNEGPALYTDFDRNHEGHAGWRADEILVGRAGIPEAGNIQTWAPQFLPDVVLLHIGTNDMLQGADANETVIEIGLIIDIVRASRPEVKILLAQVIPSRVLNEDIQSLNSAIPALVQQKNTPQSPVLLVDQYTGYDPFADNFDDVHPNQKGERKMTAKWLSALLSVLPPPSNPPPNAIYLSDLEPMSATNGLGPVERDLSNGGAGLEDGGAIKINGSTYIKGLGTRAPAEIVYDLGGSYARFQALVGVDDSSAGSVAFQIYVDDVLRFDTSTVTTFDAPDSVDVDVAGANLLRLVVTDGGDGSENDNADWALARLRVAPTVSASHFSYLRPPQSLAFTFRGNVEASLGTDDFVLENLTTQQTISPSDMLLSYDAQTNFATLTFPTFPDGALPDGQYRATIVSAGVSDHAGNPMLADHIHEFFFLRGDANHDGLVNLEDFNRLASNFGLLDRDFSQGDFNYDSQVNLADFNLLAARFGTSVLPPTTQRFAAVSAFSERLIHEIESLVEESVPV